MSRCVDITMEVIKMEDNNQNASGDLGENSSGNSQETVAYDSYKKVLAERKADQAKAKQALTEAQELRERLKDIELEKQQREGNKDDVIAALRKELTETKTSLVEKDRGYASTIIEGQIKAKAAELGCEDMGLFMAGLTQKGDLLTSVEVSDNFQVNTEDLSRVVERMKEEHPRLFKKKDIQVHDVTSINNFTNRQDKPKTKDDIINQIKLLDKQGR